MPHYRELVGSKCYLFPLTAEDTERSAGCHTGLADERNPAVVQKLVP